MHPVKTDFGMVICGTASLGLALVLVACASSSPRPTHPTTVNANTNVPIEHFAGKWKGVTYVYPYALGIEIFIQPTGPRSFAGEVHYYQLSSPPRHIARYEGRYRMEGTYDSRLRAFDFKATRWLLKPFGVYGPDPNWLGVFDAERGFLAGFPLSRKLGGDIPYFSVTRPESAKKLLVDPMIRGSVRKSSKGKPEKLNRWAARLFEEYPNLSLENMTIEKIHATALPLLEDEHFKVHFGTTYDQLSLRSKNNLNYRFGRMKNAPPASFDENLRPYALLNVLFGRSYHAAYIGGRYTSGPPVEPVHSLIVSVLSHRTFRAWTATMKARHAGLPSTRPSLEEVEFFQPVSREISRTFWPSERATISLVSEKSRGRIASGLIKSELDSLMASIRGYSGAHALIAWRSENKDLLNAALGAEGSEAHRRLDEGLNRILDPLMAQESSSLGMLDGRPDAVHWGNVWYADFKKRFAPFAGTDVYQRHLSHLTRLRPGHLELVRDEAAHFISLLGDPREIDSAVNAIMPVPGDLRSTAGRYILEASYQRKQAIQLRRNQIARASLSSVLALFLEGSRRDSQKQGSTVGPALLSYARDLAIRDALRNALPSEDAETITRLQWVCSATLEGDFSAGRFQREFLKERASKFVERQFPGNPAAPAFTDIVLSIAENMVDR